MDAYSTSNSVKIAIVGMTGSGKTVLVTTLAMKMAQMSLENIFLAPVGPNRRQTLLYTQSNWQTLNNGQWPPSTPAGELIELQWELNTKNCQATVQFLDCAGQDIRSLFKTERFNSSALSGDLKRVFESVNSANVLIFLVNMKDLLATWDATNEILDLDQMLHILQQRNDIPRRMAVVFSQYDKYKPEVDQKFNGIFEEYVNHYLPYLYGQYQKKHNFELIPVAAVNDTRDVVEDGEVKQYPVPYFSSYNLERLIHWIADSVEQLETEIEDAKKRKQKEDEERRRREAEEYARRRREEENIRQLQEKKAQEQKQKWKRYTLFTVCGLILLSILWFCSSISEINNHDIPNKPEQTQIGLHKGFGIGTQAGERKSDKINGVEFVFRWCPAGTFMMGSPWGESDRDSDETQHEVTLTKGFWIMETEVTQEQWQAVMDNNPSYFEGNDLPVENVSWNDCQEFCKKCSQLGLKIQLPTEAQWEYACRAGTTTAYFRGNDFNVNMANYDGRTWFGLGGSYKGMTTPVRNYQPNDWGLYDMCGNVCEWCQDLYGDYPSDNVTDPTGTSVGIYHVTRGGNWYRNVIRCRSAFRTRSKPEEYNNRIGFRCIIYQ